MGFPSEGRGGWLQEPPAKLFGPSAGLVELNRHSLTSVLVIGGLPEDRRRVAHTFHEQGPLGRGPFVCLDCASDESRLRAALEACLVGTVAPGAANPVAAAAGGTLFLDRVGSLSIPTQRLFLCALDRSERDEIEGLLRFGAGDAESPAAAVEEGRFLRSLYDALDKIRVDLTEPVAA